MLVIYSKKEAVKVNIGDRIKEYRLQNTWSQQELASRLHVSRQSVSRWELGSVVPDIETLVKLADIFSVDLEQLISGEIIEVNLRESISVNKKLKKFYLVAIPALLIFFSFLLILVVTRAKEESAQKEQTEFSQLTQELESLNLELNTLLRNKDILLPYKTVEKYELESLASRAKKISAKLNELDKNMLNVEDINALNKRINQVQNRINTIKEYLVVYQILQNYYDVDFLNDKGEFNRSLRSNSKPDHEEIEKVERKIRSLPNGTIKKEFEKTIDRLKNPYGEEENIIIIEEPM